MPSTVPPVAPGPRPAPLVSVIVRTVGRPTLARTLASVAAQSWRPIEIVLVDAADAGIEMSAHRSIPVRVVRGRFDRSRAANAGLAAATGEWMLLLDEDDEVAPEHVADLLAAALAQGTPAAYSQTRLVDREGRPGRVFGGGPFNRALLLNSNYLAIHAVLFHRGFIEAGCRFDEHLALFEDWDFWLQLSREASFAFTGRPTAIYHAEVGESGSGSGANLDRDRVLAMRAELMARWKA